MVKLFALTSLAVSLSCSYSASFRDCAVSCADESSCPSGFSCGTEGLCRAAGATGTCSASATDGGMTMMPDAGSSAMQDAPGSDSGITSPLDVVLSETTSSDMAEAGYGCTTVPANDCPSSTESSYPESISWYREFELSDFTGPPWNVTGAFDITHVHFACWSSSTAASVTVKVYGYSGTFFDTTIAQSRLTQLASVTATIGPSQVFTCTDDVDIPLTVEIPAGSGFIVGILASDTVSDDFGTCGISPAIRLGANGSGESRDSYVGAYCTGVGSAEAWSTNDTLISVEGTTE